MKLIVRIILLGWVYYRVSPIPGLGSCSRSEPGVFGSLEPEPESLEKKPGVGDGARAAWKKSQEPEPEPLKICQLLSPARR